MLLQSLILATTTQEATRKIHFTLEVTPELFLAGITAITAMISVIVEETKLNLTYDFGHTHGRPSQSSSDYSLKMIANGLVDISEKSL